MMSNLRQSCAFLTTAALLLIPVAGLVATPAAQAQSSTLTTQFVCVTAGKNFATIAQRGSRRTPPMILWTKAQGGLSPQQRCNSVTANLNRAVSSSGVRRLSSLSLTSGLVNNSQVICFVTSRDAAKVCSSENVVMTLRPEDNPTEILQQIRDFSTTATGNPVVRGEQNNEVYDLGLAIDQTLSQLDDGKAPATNPTRPL